MKKMMLTAVVSLFAACGGAPVEETGESQEALMGQGRCERDGNGNMTGYCVATNCLRKFVPTQCSFGQYGPPSQPLCGYSTATRTCLF